MAGITDPDSVSTWAGNKPYQHGKENGMEQNDGTIVRYSVDGSQDGPVDLDVESNWENVWKQVVLNADGTVNLEKVKQELFDYWVCMQEVTRVYDELIWVRSPSGSARTSWRRSEKCGASWRRRSTGRLRG